MVIISEMLDICERFVQSCNVTAGNQTCNLLIASPMPLATMLLSLISMEWIVT